MIGKRGKENLYELKLCKLKLQLLKNITIMITRLQTVVYSVLLVILVEAFSISEWQVEVLPMAQDVIGGGNVTCRSITWQNF